MRTSMNHWLKVSFALLLSTAVVSGVNAQDEATEADEAKVVKVEKTKVDRLAERRLNTISKSQTPAQGFAPVDMFDAIDSKDIEVLIRTKSAADSNLIVKNNSDKPLAIQMPEAFSAVPVYRQGVGAPGLGGGGLGGGGLGGGGLGGGGFGGGGLGGGNQGVGGGFGGGLGGGGFGGGGLGGGGLGGGGFGGGGGVFNIPPGRVGKVAVKTFCLEEGKPDPKSRIEYVIQPLDKLNSDPKIFEMCRMLANDEITQPVAQAAAWNVANGLTWQELLLKNRIVRMDGSFERYFHPMHIRYAQQVTVASAQRADSRKKQSDKPSDEDRYNARYGNAQ